MFNGVAPENTKKIIKRLITYINDFGQYDIQLVLMTVPSKLKPHLFMISGFATSYYRLPAQDGRGQDRFANMFDGSRLLQMAEAIPTAQLDSLKRNDLRSETATMLLKLISKIKYLNILQLHHIDIGTRFQVAGDEQVSHSPTKQSPRVFAAQEAEVECPTRIWYDAGGDYRGGIVMSSQSIQDDA